VTVVICCELISFLCYITLHHVITESYKKYALYYCETRGGSRILEKRGPKVDPRWGIGCSGRIISTFPGLLPNPPLPVFSLPLPSSFSLPLISTLLLSLPIPSPLFSFPTFPSPPGGPPRNTARGSEGALKLPQRVRAEWSPAVRRFLEHFRLKRTFL